MKIVDLLIMAIGLSMDAFAVAICKGMAVGSVRNDEALWVGMWFGCFQGLMPLGGFYLASIFSDAIASVDHWIAFLLLAVIGITMIKESTESQEEISRDLRVKAVLLLAIATSIDALAAGISLVAVIDGRLIIGGRLNGNSIWVAVVLIGLVTFFCSAVGMKLGGRLGAQWGKKAELAGGGVLIFLGTKILLEHLALLG